jgi:CRP-like cAMP-binding protein
MKADINENLKSGYLFEEMTDAQLSAVAKLAERVFFQPGERLLEEGDLGGALFVLRSGSVQISRLTKAGGKTVALQGAGSVIGELAIVGNRRRTATVTASEATEAFKLEKNDLLQLLRGDSDLAARFYRCLAQVLAERMHDATERLAFLMGHGEEHHWLSV